MLIVIYRYNFSIGGASKNKNTRKKKETYLSLMNAATWLEATARARARGRAHLWFEALRQQLQHIVRTFVFTVNCSILYSMQPERSKRKRGYKLILSLLDF